MFNLWVNENVKIYKRWRTWIMIGLLFLLVIGGSVLVKVSEDNYQEQYRSDLQQENSREVYSGWKAHEKQKIANFEDQLRQHGKNMTIEQKRHYENEIKLATYRLEHDKSPITPPIWENIEGATTLAFQLITLFVVVIAADIVSSEFTWGTIKLLLIRSVSRTKILLAKYLATLSFALLLLGLLFVTIFTISGILYGFNGFNQTIITLSSEGTVIERSRFSHILYSYGFESITLIIIFTIAFMISTVFRSSSLAIGISLLTLFLGVTVSGIFFEYSWINYFLFTHIANIQAYMNFGETLKEELTLSYSFIVIFIYYVIFLFSSWYIFSKRDVTA